MKHDAAVEAPLRERVSAEEWRLRCELAAAHRLIAHFVSVDLTYNHISARLPGEPRHFLVKADNVFMEQVTASNLVKYDVDGKQVMGSAHKASPAAYNLHAAGLALCAEPITCLPSTSYLTRFEAVTCSMKTLSAFTRKCRGSPGKRAEIWL